MARKMRFLWVLSLFLIFSGITLAFCGFYVAKIDADLFNESSEVIIARAGDRTILTMANDFKGEVSEFAMVVPIPYVFTQDQIQVGDPNIFDRIDAYSAPRLVEYYDDNPCWRDDRQLGFSLNSVTESASVADVLEKNAQSLGVTIEESFSVGEYDILVLGAEESDGLETWLIENDYRMPVGASEALVPYIEMGMKFFVAKVNLEAFEESEFNQLRPLLMAFESDDFMLPIQLGMVNAAGAQDLVLYLLSPEGRIEVSNYDTVGLPTDINVPDFVENEFGSMYKAIFDTAYEREGEKAVFMEYAWDMAWCDPCAADPLNGEELRQAGVHWLGQNDDGVAPNIYLTRLHVRYTPEMFPEDLKFRVTKNRDNFQGRYIMQRPYDGEITCEAGESYVEQVRDRQQEEAKQLANVTGWSFGEIMSKIEPYEPTVSIPNWWERVFDRFN